MASYDPKTALLVVDIQNDFADPKGSLYVRGGEKVIEVANREADRARAAGALLVYSRDWHPEVTPHFKKYGGIWPVHCVRETWGSQPPPHLKVDGEILRKGTGGEDGYSAFTVQDPINAEKKATHLEALLRERGIERVVIVGLATDYCVKETALDAVRHGFATTVISAGVRAVNLNPDDGERALEEIRAAGGKVE